VSATSLVFDVATRKIMAVTNTGLVQEMPFDLQQKISGETIRGIDVYAGKHACTVDSIANRLLIVSVTDFLQLFGGIPAAEKKTARGRMSDILIDCFVVASRA
jgi:hypothetical protein